MAFVSLVTEEQADANLKAVYQQIKDKFGFLPNFFQALGRSPALLDTQIALYAAILGDGALPRALKEQIVLVVSGINSSMYCVAAHMEILQTLGVEKQLARKLATDYLSAAVDQKTKELFRFADKLTRNSADIEPADLDRLRQVGWDEAAIFEAAMAVAYANYVNRVSIGLGLMPDF